MLTSKLCLQDDILYLESEIMLANNKAGKIKASSLHLHSELATARATEKRIGGSEKCRCRLGKE
jgi:hypothetical protein